MLLTYLEQGAALGQRVEDGVREEPGVVQQLVLVLDAVVAVYKVQVGLLRGALRGRAAARAAAQHVQVAVVAARVLGGQRQVEEQPLGQRGDVVQVAERRAGAPSVGAAVLGHVAGLVADAQPHALLGLLVLLDLCVQAVALLFGHPAELDG